MYQIFLNIIYKRNGKNKMYRNIFKTFIRYACCADLSKPKINRIRQTQSPARQEKKQQQQYLMEQLHR